MAVDAKLVGRWEKWSGKSRDFWMKFDGKFREVLKLEAKNC
jgi:hypothetical protein